MIINNLPLLPERTRRLSGDITYINQTHWTNKEGRRSHPRGKTYYTTATATTDYPIIYLDCCTRTILPTCHGPFTRSFHPQEKKKRPFPSRIGSSGFAWVTVHHPTCAPIPLPLFFFPFSTLACTLLPFQLPRRLLSRAAMPPRTV